MTHPMFANMNDKSAPRAFSWIWFIRFAQIALSIIVLALAAWNSSDLKSYHCDVPGKIGYNIAVAVLSMIAATYFVFSTGPSHIFRVLPWLVYGQIALDGLMVILWISAAATSPMSDVDIFNACFVQQTYDPNDYFTYDPNAKRSLSGSLEPRRSRSSSSRTRTSSWSSVNARTAMDALLVILFLITKLSTLWWVYQSRHSAGSAAPTTQPQTHNDYHGGAGAPMAHGDIHGATDLPMVAPKEPTVSYSQPQMEQSQYYQGQPQPAYNQSTPQAQYAQPHPGYPSPQLQPANPAYTGHQH